MLPHAEQRGDGLRKLPVAHRPQHAERAHSDRQPRMLARAWHGSRGRAGRRTFQRLPHTVHVTKVVIGSSADRVCFW